MAARSPDCPDGTDLPRVGLYLGTSGLSYARWRGVFFPEEIKPADWFRFYASRFDACEINASFYRLPSEAAVAGWARNAPRGFVFAWKASNYLTHSNRLEDPRDSLDLIFGRMRGLGVHAGPRCSNCIRA